MGLTNHATVSHDQVMKPTKAMTIRLNEQQAHELDTVASVDQLSVVEVVRAAIDEHVAARKTDPRFQENLRDHIDRVQQLLDS